MFLRNILYIALAGLACMACSSEQPDGTATDLPAGYSRIRLVLEPTSLDIGSRSTAWTDPNAADGEMFQQAYVVMANSSGEVTSIHKVTPTAASATETEREVVAYITTENGEYTFYNIGNIEPETVTTSGTDITSATFNGLTFTVGSAVPDGIAASTSTGAFNNYVVPATGIPMTNIETHTVNSNETIILQLYRQLAKMRFVFTNATEQALGITDVSVGGITKDNTTIYYFPRKNENNSPVVEFPTATDTTTLNYYHNADTPFELAADNTAHSLPDAYLNESASQHATGRFPLSVTTVQTAEDGTQTTDIRRALITLGNIPRNSFVRVPVTLTDYVMDFSAFFYPPIGGYPAFTMEKHEEEFYATFYGEGDFQLIPRVYRYADRNNPEKWYSLNDTEHIESYTLVVSDTQGIFSTQPHLDPITGEILGTLSGTKGRAAVRLTVYIKVNDTQTQVYNRTVYFVVA